MKRACYMAVAVALSLTACGPQTAPITGPPAAGVEVKPPATAAPHTAPKKYLKVHVVNVGQADGIIIECPDDQVGMVIDSADSRDKAGKAAFQAYLSKLMEKDKDKSIPLVVATHPHSDHIGHLQVGGRDLRRRGVRGQRPARHQRRLQRPYDRGERRRLAPIDGSSLVTIAAERDHRAQTDHHRQRPHSLLLKATVAPLRTVSLHACVRIGVSPVEDDGPSMPRYLQ